MPYQAVVLHMCLWCRPVRSEGTGPSPVHFADELLPAAQSVSVQELLQREVSLQQAAAASRASPTRSSSSSSDSSSSSSDDAEVSEAVWLSADEVLLLWLMMRLCIHLLGRP